MKNCLHQTGLWACLWSILDWWFIWGPPLREAPPLGRWDLGCVGNLVECWEQASKQLPSKESTLVPASSFLPWVPAQLHSVCKIKQTLSSTSCFWSHYLSITPTASNYNKTSIIRVGLLLWQTWPCWYGEGFWIFGLEKPLDAQNLQGCSMAA